MLDDPLPMQRELNPGKADWLARMGFAACDEVENFCRIFHLPDTETAGEIARCAILILWNIYGLAPESRIQIKLVLE